ncbi:hypothetical protein AVEN_8458-1 [Araneus ventricosus]|uniref:Uncharacterized protein n=1 Tax=Araneus ventricosus TaxID=182803 RepID=A0A4Y2EWF1_ARAVE|nr:hypothetical protein AVEN_8458-1 [Araneus ventricosus]
MPAQVSSSSSDRGSKLRGPSQNSLRVASNWDVNITKLLNQYECYLRQNLVALNRDRYLNRHLSSKFHATPGGGCLTLDIRFACTGPAS